MPHAKQRRANAFPTFLFWCFVFISFPLCSGFASPAENCNPFFFSFLTSLHFCWCASFFGPPCFRNRALFCLHWQPWRRRGAPGVSVLPSLVLSACEQSSSGGGGGQPRTYSTAINLPVRSSVPLVRLPSVICLFFPFSFPPSSSSFAPLGFQKADSTFSVPLACMWLSRAMHRPLCGAVCN